MVMAFLSLLAMVEARFWFFFWSMDAWIIALLLGSNMSWLPIMGDEEWSMELLGLTTGKEEPKTFKKEVITDAPWWRPRSMVNLNLIASSSSFFLWLRMVDFKLKRGCSITEKEKNLSYCTYLSHTFIGIRILSLYFSFNKRRNWRKAFALLRWRLGHHWRITITVKLSLA